MCDHTYYTLYIFVCMCVVYTTTMCLSGSRLIGFKTLELETWFSKVCVCNAMLFFLVKTLAWHDNREEKV